LVFLFAAGVPCIIGAFLLLDVIYNKTTYFVFSDCITKGGR
jgi:hypothetical protein